jgi:hypothetical protein
MVRSVDFGSKAPLLLIVTGPPTTPLPRSVAPEVTFNAPDPFVPVITRTPLLTVVVPV